MMNTEELETLAKKFGSIPSGLTKKTDLVPAYLTEEEFDNLKFCPREGTVESRGKWPTIGGRRTYPMSGILNDEEKAIYNQMVAAERTGTTTGTRTVRSSETPEQKAAREERWMRLLDHVVEAKDSEGIMMLLQMPEFPETCKNNLMMKLLSSGAINL